MLSNPFVGATPLVSQTQAAVAPQTPSTVRVAPDGTEWAVATLVMAALGVLVLFRVAGFQAVIGASVGK